MYTYLGRRFHSQHNPDQEASRQWEVFLKNQTVRPDLLVIVSPGLNYLGRFIRSVHPDIKIVSVFADSQSWDARVWDSDYDIVCRDPGFSGFFEWLEVRAQMILLKNPAFLFHPVFNSVAPDISAALQSRVATILKRAKLEMLSQGYFSYILPGIVRRNVRALAEHAALALPARIPQSDDRFCVIASSGGSLAAHAEFLREHRSRLYLISLPSSIAAIDAMGLEPDIVVSIDPGYWAAVHLRSLPRHWKSRVCASLKANLPLSDAEFRRRLLFFSTSTTTELAALAGSGLSLPCFPERGTVAASALDIAGSMSSKPVLVLGQDLASLHYLSHVHPHTLDFYHVVRANRFAGFEKAKVWGALGNGPTPTESDPEDGILSSPSLDYYRSWLVENAGSHYPFAVAPKSQFPWNGLRTVDQPADVFGLPARERQELGFTEGMDPGRLERLLADLENFSSAAPSWGLGSDFNTDLDSLLRETAYFAYKALVNGRSDDTADLDSVVRGLLAGSGGWS